MSKKHSAVFFFIILGFLCCPSALICESMDELSEKYEKAYNALVPPSNSSMNSDYKMEQVAVGTMYTAKSLKMLYNQNQEQTNQNKVIIKQNNEIIRLLKIIAKKGMAKP
jgi:hypothetical protein